MEENQRGDRGREEGSGEGLEGRESERRGERGKEGVERGWRERRREWRGAGGKRIRQEIDGGTGGKKETEGLHGGKEGVESDLEPTMKTTAPGGVRQRAGATAGQEVCLGRERQAECQSDRGAAHRRPLTCWCLYTVKGIQLQHRKPPPPPGFVTDAGWIYQQQIFLLFQPIGAAWWCVGEKAGGE
ncbi:hypothetical protein Pcinc_002458 [Petrolisthes cinctipes]|uniref:Uncharacterized protein n=1 Tax=Petrolisthes cinctipes TaxID=88211 RepID=A0AAE1L5E7_PETCI|nr:hypothetical protein Pcinc_002458 [Petrolisthes cinctipes]